MPKILLADDSTHAQRMGVKILSAEGFEVTTVSNGKAAIDSFKKSIPDLVVADVFMPGRNGYEVCQHVKTTDELKHIPVLLIIGAMEPYDPDEGKKAGADGVITKPLESSNLVNTVKGLIDAAKRFAPAKPKPKKEKAPDEPITTAPDPYAPIVEDPAWAQEEEIITTNPRQEEIVIPQALSQQPVGMLTELLESPPAEQPAPFPVEDTGSPFMAEQGLELPVSSNPETLEALFPPSAADAVMPASLIESAEPAAPAASVAAPAPVSESWIAEKVAVSKEDEKLFEQPAASWSDLAQMAEAITAEPESAPVLPWKSEPGLIQADTTDVPAGTADGIEHFENLNETISSHAPISLAALGIGVEPIPMPMPTVDDAGPTMPSFDEAIILSPADVSARASQEASVPVDPEFDRGFEPITAAVPLQIAPEPAPEPAIEPTPEPEAAASVMAAAEKAIELPVAVTAAPSAGQTGDALVEAAVAMVREATEIELAAEAAASANPAESPKVDPATLEHVIRGVVGELMPQIVAQVKSALKG